MNDSSRSFYQFSFFAKLKFGKPKCSFHYLPIPEGSHINVVGLFQAVLGRHCQVDEIYKASMRHVGERWRTSYHRVIRVYNVQYIIAFQLKSRRERIWVSKSLTSFAESVNV